MPRYLQSYCTCGGAVMPREGRAGVSAQRESRRRQQGACREQRAVNHRLAGAHGDVGDAQAGVLRAAPVKRLRSGGADRQ